MQEWFIGHALFDAEASIVHHFAFHHEPASFKFPHLEAGIVVSQPVLRRCVPFGFVSLFSTNDVFLFSIESAPDSERDNCRAISPSTRLMSSPCT